MSSNPKYNNAGLSSYYASFRADDTLISILPAFDFNSYDDEIPNRLFQSTLETTNFGPFKAGMEATVPLWMAVVLQQRSFAQIVFPEWLSTTNLSHIIQYEKSHELLFPTTSSRSATGSSSKSAPKNNWNAEDDPDGDNTVSSATLEDPSQSTHSLPENYYEVALRLTSAAQSSAAPPAQDSSHSVLSLLVQDLFEIRVDKLRQQFQTLMEDTVRRNLGADGTPPSAWTDLIINVTGIGTQELTAVQPYVQQAMQDIYSLASNDMPQAKESLSEKDATETQRRSSLVKRRLR